MKRILHPAAIREEAEALFPELQAWRRHLHRHPEVGFREEETARFIEQVLREQGLKPRRVAGTGVVVDIEGARSGPVRAYRADIDALPIQEVGKEAYASTVPGVAHLCGHDAHTTVALGIATLLQRRRDVLRGTVRILFQPAEEPTPSGAPEMIAAGVLEHVRFILALHVDPSLPVGRFGFKSGVINAATDAFHVVVRSERTAHSSAPHTVADPVWIATQIAALFYQLPGRVHDARHPSVWALTRLEAGGNALNVIPDRAVLAGTLRSTDARAREATVARMQALAEQVAAMHGASVEVEIHRGAPPVVNDARLIERAEEAARTLFGEESIHRFVLPSMGGEDFAHYLKHVPGALIRLGVSSGPETSFELHDARFDLDEQALVYGVALMTTLLSEGEK